MKLVEVLVAGSLALLFTLLLFRLWGGMLAAQENAVHRIQAVNDAAILVNGFRENPLAPGGSFSGTVAFRGITGITRFDGTEANGFRYRELRFILLGIPCRARAGYDE